MSFKANGNIIHECNYFVAWTVKYNRPVLNGVHEDIIEPTIKELEEQMKVKVSDIFVSPNRVELFVSIDPKMDVNRFIKAAKGNTSNVLRDRFPELKKRLPTLWSNSYLVFSVGTIDDELLRWYHRSQPVSESKISKTRWQKFLSKAS